ncbi:MAG: aminotransferase class I/II-fold pyridoxal phosphate-dependent enzyme [bacterium]|nr:aminotransferase class I/II-fold pyridoxal phosphate-dependent enzyme [bacterium]
MLHPSARLKNLPPYFFSVIGDRIRQMQSEKIKVYRLDIGNPDMPPPSAVVESLATSASNPKNHGYNSYRGTPAFRRALAKHYQRRFAVTVDPETEILPLLGSKEGIVNLTLAHLSKGDIALVPDIGYPAYAMGTRLAEAEVYWVKLDPARGYRPNLDEIPADILKRAKVLWINYPNNPTGAMITLADYNQIASFCQKHDILLISDNPYMDVLFEGATAPSALQTDTDRSHVLEFFSFSKSYNMAGWRLGAALGSKDAIDNLLAIKSNIDSAHFTPVYDAGITALDTPQSWIDERNAIYQRRRDKIMSVLPHVGLSAEVPMGSLYVWAKVLDGDATAYVESALNNAHVSLAPGAAYGPGGNDYVRFSVGVEDSELSEALDALQSWYKQR